jgi:hypothetical protein
MNRDQPRTKTHPVDIFSRTALAACFVALSTYAGYGISYLLSLPL